MSGRSGRTDACGADGHGGGGEAGRSEVLRGNPSAGRASHATDPQLLIGLWLYACIRGIGSARELARRREESAAFQWLCGGVSVNHRLLSEFRTGHGEALDELFTQVIASLVDKEVVKVSRISQDGTRVRMSAGASGFVGQSGWRSCWQKRSSMWRSCGNRWTRRSMLRKSRPGGRE
jgi:hypothetical protein